MREAFLIGGVVFGVLATIVTAILIGRWLLGVNGYLALFYCLLMASIGIAAAAYCDDK